MTVRLKPSPSASPASPFSWDKVPSSPLSAADGPSEPGSPPTQWLSARDMKVFGADPLHQQVAVMKCKDCGKPVLESAMAEHANNCAKIRAGGKKGGKGKAAADDGDSKKGKKRKAEDDDPTPDDPSAPKKKKPATKVTKGRFKGPVDYDRQCGVINDKNLPCSRSLTCKSHSMGAKRAVPNRSRPYDELLLEWNRLHNPNFVEPVKRESKAERKERKEKEKTEKKRLAMEAAAAAGIDLTAKKSGTATGGTGTKKSKKATGIANVAVTGASATAAHTTTKNEDDENLDDIDSEAEVDTLVRAVKAAQDRGVLGVPLAVPCDASSWFVARRERARTCRDLLANALMPQTRTGPPGVVAPGRLV